MMDLLERLRLAARLSAEINPIEAEAADEIERLKRRHRDATAAHPQSVKLSQVLQVCRICGGPVSVPFVLDFGREFAHERCLADAVELRV